MTFLIDLRHALRGLLRTPGFTAIAALTLALGIGATTAIFSLIHAVLFRPLPYPDSQRMVYVRETGPDGRPNGRVSGGAFKDWRTQGSRFTHLAIFEDVRRNLTGMGMPERVEGLKVSADFLSVLRVKPILGRDFFPQEDAVGGNNRVLLLTHALWQSRFAGDAGVVGKVISLDQIPHTIIGVLPPRALLWDEARFLVPEVVDAPGVNWSYGGHWREVIGRLAPGATPEGLEAELVAVKQRLATDYPAFKKDWGVSVVPLQEVFAEGDRPRLAMLLGAVAMLLLIACVNVSNLLLARANGRSRELAIRSALGARSSRIMRQLLTESLLLALAGCAVGVFFAQVGIRLLARLAEGQLPQVMHPTLNASVLTFSILVACGCGVLSGLLPALRGMRVDLNGALKEAERGSTSGSKKRTQSLLVVSQFAFTLMLLIGSGLFLRSFLRVLGADPGFEPRQTLAFDLSFPEARYPDTESRLRFVQELNGRIADIPGIEAIGAVSKLPFSNQGETEMVSRTDRPGRTDYLAQCSYMSGDYFAAMGIRLLRGRALTDADNQVGAARVLVIDSGLARDLFPDEEALGRHLRFQGASWEIVGIVPPVRHFRLDATPLPNLYLAQAHGLVSTSLVARTTLHPLSLVKTIRETILKADPDQPIAHVRTLEQAIRKSLAVKRITLSLLVAFAGVALALACLGLYSVVAYATGQRRREFCIRAALGAQRRDILQLVLKDGLAPTAAGIVLGLMGAFALGRTLKSQLYGIHPTDPLTLLLASAGLLLVALPATLLPASRAARVQPSIALRSE